MKITGETPNEKSYIDLSTVLTLLGRVDETQLPRAQQNALNDITIAVLRLKMDLLVVISEEQDKA